MRTVTFQSVLNGVASALGLDPKRDLNPARAASLAEFITKRVEFGWRFDFWPEWTPVEQRGYRLPYNSGTAYPAPILGSPVEVFFPPTVSYYQALRATTGNAPAVLVNGVWQVDGAHWALSAPGYGMPVWSGDGYSTGVLPPPGYAGPDWQPNTAYAGGAVGTAGDLVRNPNDNQFYQCFTAHTSGANFDAAKFGLLTPFDKYIACDQAGQTPIDEVKRVCRKNPRVFPKTPGRLEFQVSANGIQLAQTAPALVWVEFRLRPPVFTSEVYKAGTSYAAGALTLSTVSGDCYGALQTALGQEPSVSPTYWQKVNFPRVLARAVKRLALADAYRDQKQNDRADDEEERGREELQDEWDAVLASQGQWDTAQAVTYGS